MTMNSTGAISLAGTTAGVSIQIENGGNGTTTISLNDAAVRCLAKVATGSISMPTNFYGKSNRVNITVTLASSTAYYTFDPTKISGYKAGLTCATLKINSGVYVYSGSTGSQAMTINGWTTGDSVKVINCGAIVGMGGNGGRGLDYNYGNGSAGGGGGTALVVQYPVNITNNNTIAGGGGGGGGGYGGAFTCQPGYTCPLDGAYIRGCPVTYYRVGGGGGGGRTGLTNSSGGPGFCGSSSGGVGTVNGPGGGGAGGSGGGSGGCGGGWGSSGISGICGGTSGGSAGPATVGNSNITWTATGNRYGPLN